MLCEFHLNNKFFKKAPIMSLISNHFLKKLQSSSMIKLLTAALYTAHRHVKYSPNP